MNKEKTSIAGERTQNDHPQADPDYPGSERGGFLFNGKTAEEWFVLHEVLRADFRRVLHEKELLQPPTNNDHVEQGCEQFAQHPRAWAELYCTVLRMALNTYSAALVPIIRRKAKTDSDVLVLMPKQISVIQEAEAYALKVINL